MKRWISHAASLFVSTIEIGYIEKTIDIYSRRGAENAKVDEYNDTSLQKTHVTSALSAPLRLCEKKGC